MVMYKPSLFSDRQTITRQVAAKLIREYRARGFKFKPKYPRGCGRRAWDALGMFDKVLFAW